MKKITSQTGNAHEINAATEDEENQPLSFLIEYVIPLLKVAQTDLYDQAKCAQAYFLWKVERTEPDAWRTHDLMVEQSGYGVSIRWFLRLRGRPNPILVPLKHSKATTYTRRDLRKAEHWLQDLILDIESDLVKLRKQSQALGKVGRGIDAVDQAFQTDCNSDICDYDEYVEESDMAI